MKEHIVGWYHQSIQCHYLSRNDRENNILKPNWRTHWAQGKPIWCPTKASFGSCSYTCTAAGKNPALCGCLFPVLKKDLKDQKETKHCYRKQMYKALHEFCYLLLFFKKKPQHLSMRVNWGVCISFLQLDPVNQFLLASSAYSYFPRSLLCKQNSKRKIQLTSSLLGLAGDLTGAAGYLTDLLQMHY